MAKKFMSTITHKNFISLIFFLALGLFVLNFFVLGELKSTKDLFLIALFIATAGLIYAYTRLNVINPLRLLKRELKKSKITVIEHLSDEAEGRMDAGEYIISGSLEAIKKLSGEIGNATEFIEAIENGKLDVDYKGIDTNEKGHLATALLSMRDQMIVIAEQEKERNWASEGLAKFADILRIGTENIEELYDSIIRNVVKYTNANQGGLYIVNQENEKDKYLDLVAYYAYERKKYIVKKYEIEEGLLGQCYLEKDVVMLTEVPENYTIITSGTGEATPKCILIIPLKINEDVFGVIELASFVAFKPYQVEFLKKLGENIASTISNVKINERTKTLLQDSQMQTENMRNQEEEMRQNMEELNATQEEMKRSETIHLKEIERLQVLHEENLKEAQLKNEELKKAEDETKELMYEIQASQEEITKNYNILFEKFNEFNIKSKFDQLTSIRSTKKRNIEDYFNIIRSQIMTYSEDKMIVDAMRSFKSVFHNIGKNIPEKELKMMTNHVTEYYETEFLPKLNANTEEPEKLEKYWDNDPRTIMMQYQYISNNKNETGKKHLQDHADDGSEYSKLHALYHPVIRNYLLTFGYYDIFLIDNETGHLVYSVFKEVDYTTSLLSGPYKNTNFAQVFREARNAQKNEFIKLVDFEPYDPSYTAPASFIATPIYDGEEKIGVLIFQMPIDKINSIMTGDKKWTEDGLGTSGETYLVGDDYKMRSISRFLIEDPVGYFNELQRIGYNENSIRKIRKLNTTILLQDVKTEAVINALRGNTDKKIVLDYRNISD
jgi:GAF domain-containing protein